MFSVFGKNSENKEILKFISKVKKELKNKNIDSDVLDELYSLYYSIDSYLDIDGWSDYKNRAEKANSMMKSVYFYPEVEPVLSGGVKWFKMSHRGKTDYFRTMDEAEEAASTIRKKIDRVKRYNKRLDEISGYWYEHYHNARKEALDAMVSKILGMLESKDNKYIKTIATLAMGPFLFYYDIDGKNSEIYEACSDALEKHEYMLKKSM